MKDQLISFKTAKLAKEKGFDIDVNYFISQYNKDGVIVFSEYVDCDNYNHKNWNSDNRIHLFSRPTQSLLQKWLREKFRININIFVEKFNFDGLYRAFYYETSIEIDDLRSNKVTNKRNRSTELFKDWVHNRSNKTYEESLELALIEGLNLI